MVATCSSSAASHTPVSTLTETTNNQASDQSPNQLTVCLRRRRVRNSRAHRITTITTHFSRSNISSGKCESIHKSRHSIQSAASIWRRRRRMYEAKEARHLSVLRRSGKNARVDAHSRCGDNRNALCVCTTITITYDRTNDNDVGAWFCVLSPSYCFPLTHHNPSVACGDFAASSSSSRLFHSCLAASQLLWDSSSSSVFGCSLVLD